jgi:hypothetical protein
VRTPVFLPNQQHTQEERRYCRQSNNEGVQFTDLVDIVAIKAGLHCVESQIGVAGEAFVGVVWVVDGAALRSLFFATFSGDRRDPARLTTGAFSLGGSASVHAVVWELLLFIFFVRASRFIILQELLQAASAEHRSVLAPLDWQIAIRELQLHTAGWAFEVVSILAVAALIRVEQVVKGGGFAILYCDVLVAEAILSLCFRDDLSVSAAAAPGGFSISLAVVAVLRGATSGARNGGA